MEADDAVNAEFNSSFNDNKFVTILLFADDQVIAAGNEESLQRSLYELQQKTGTYGLEISGIKLTEVYRSWFSVRW